jgi:hypothetical protein
VETHLDGTGAELASLFSVARAAFDTLIQECEKGMANATRAESVRKALKSKKAADLAAVLQGQRTNETRK